jgi:hypothetical protein
VLGDPRFSPSPRVRALASIEEGEATLERRRFLGRARERIGDALLLVAEHRKVLRLFQLILPTVPR